MKWNGVSVRKRAKSIRVWSDFFFEEDRVGRISPAGKRLPGPFLRLAHFSMKIRQPTGFVLATAGFLPATTAEMASRRSRVLGLGRRLPKSV